MTIRHRTARDPALGASIVSRRPLYYSAGADEALDRPAHVRAGSGLAWVGGRLALVQDDANFVALVDPTGPRVDSVLLPAGEGGLRQFDDARGNKRFKLDLEACAGVPHEGGTLLVALGSGSSPRRETIVTVAGLGAGEPEVATWHAPRFYAALRGEPDFAGSEMNVEGAVYLAGRLRLFGRGNGARGGDAAPLNATCEVDWPALLAHLRDPGGTPPPSPSDVAQYDLGDLEGVPLGFTDATPFAGSILFTAAAEDSPNAVDDGPVTGSVLGLIDPGGRVRWAPLVEGDGAAFTGKVEGVAVADARAGRLYVVVDGDDPAAPSELCEVQLSGPWAGEG